jgi:SAM-dependent methyltransferase
MRAIVVALALAASPCAAQDKPFEPYEGQPGKDVVWVPTPRVLIDKMLDVARVTPRDFVVDLGSGDGRLVIAAAKRGARALGMEYDDNLVAYSQRSAQQQGVADKAQFVKADIFASDFSQASVLTLFLLPEMNQRLRPQFLAMKPGTRIVANYFGIGDWSSDESVKVPDTDKCGNYCVAYLWIVPARVEGTWLMPQGDLTLVQGYQYFKGWLFSSSGTKEVTQGRMRGDTLNFTLDGVSYSGRVNGDAIEGTALHEGSSARWTAVRKAP